MEVYKIDITSWTASFRYPNLISGIQPTLEVPPISTVLGLINAAAGFYIDYEGMSLAYYFQYEMEGEDLETIYQINSNKDGKPTNEAKSNVIVRKFLYNNFLRIYTVDERIANYFSNPYYPILLGRMNDLATVVKVSGRESLEKRDTAQNISGQIIPFEYHLPGQIQALPQYFSNDFPRRNLGTKPFSVISHKASVSGNIEILKDTLPSGEVIDVYFHEINYNQ